MKLLGGTEHWSDKGVASACNRAWHKRHPVHTCRRKSRVKILCVLLLQLEQQGCKQPARKAAANRADDSSALVTKGHGPHLSNYGAVEGCYSYLIFVIII